MHFIYKKNDVILTDCKFLQEKTSEMLQIVSYGIFWAGKFYKIYFTEIQRELTL